MQDFRLFLVAKMYYVDDMQQSEIARQLDLSPMMVSRLLERAKKEGIVTFQVKSTNCVLWELGAKIKRLYPTLKDALVVADEENIDPRDQVGKAAAEYLQGILKDHSVVGISWGRSILSLINALRTSSCDNVAIAQMSGGFLCESSFDMMPSNIVKKASDLLGATPIFLNAPMFVPSEEIKKSLMKDRLLQYLNKIFQKMDIALYGISDIRQATTMKSVGIITDEEEKELKSLGAIGDVMGYFIDGNGKIINWTKSPCYMGASIQTAASADHSVCLATGKDKSRILDVAIRHHYMNTIIISEGLAHALLDKDFS